MSVLERAAAAASGRGAEAPRPSLLERANAAAQGDGLPPAPPEGRFALNMPPADVLRQRTMDAAQALQQGTQARDQEMLAWSQQNLSPEQQARLAEQQFNRHAAASQIAPSTPGDAFAAQNDMARAGRFAQGYEQAQAAAVQQQEEAARQAQQAQHPDLISGTVGGDKWYQWADEVAAARGWLGRTFGHIPDQLEKRSGQVGEAVGEAIMGRPVPKTPEEIALWRDETALKRERAAEIVGRMTPVQKAALAVHGLAYPILKPLGMTDADIYELEQVYGAAQDFWKNARQEEQGQPTGFVSGAREMTLGGLERMAGTTAGMESPTPAEDEGKGMVGQMLSGAYLGPREQQPFLSDSAALQALQRVRLLEDLVATPISMGAYGDPDKMSNRARAVADIAAGTIAAEGPKVVRHALSDALGESTHVTPQAINAALRAQDDAAEQAQRGLAYVRSNPATPENTFGDISQAYRTRVGEKAAFTTPQSPDQIFGDINDAYRRRVARAADDARPSTPEGVFGDINAEYRQRVDKAAAEAMPEATRAPAGPPPEAPPVPPPAVAETPKPEAPAPPAQQAVQSPNAVDIHFRRPEAWTPPKPGRESVTVSVDDLDRAWKAQDAANYVGPGGQAANPQKGKYEAATQTVARLAQSGEPLDQPVVGTAGGFGFTDGRHRFAALRDAGAKTITVQTDDAAGLKRLLEGAPAAPESPPGRSTDALRRDLAAKSNELARLDPSSRAYQKAEVEYTRLETAYRRELAREQRASPEAMQQAAQAQAPYGAGSRGQRRAEKQQALGKAAAAPQVEAMPRVAPADEAANMGPMMASMGRDLAANMSRGDAERIAKAAHVTSDAGSVSYYRDRVLPLMDSGVEMVHPDGRHLFTGDAGVMKRAEAAGFVKQADPMSNVAARFEPVAEKRLRTTNTQQTRLPTTSTTGPVTQATAAPGETPKGPSDIVRTFTGEGGASVPVQTAAKREKVPGDLKGWYEFTRRQVNVKKVSDLQTLGHEVGHALVHKGTVPVGSVPRDVMDELRTWGASVGLQPTAATSLEEEALVEALGNWFAYDNTVHDLPAFTRWFDAQAARSDLNFMRDGRDIATKWRTAHPRDAIRAVTSGPAAESLYKSNKPSAWMRFWLAAFDKTAALDRLLKDAGLGKLEGALNPAKVLRALGPTASARFAHFVEHGVLMGAHGLTTIKRAGREVSLTKALKAVKKAIGVEGVRDTLNYMRAQRAADLFDRVEEFAGSSGRFAGQGEAEARQALKAQRQALKAAKQAKDAAAAATARKEIARLEKMIDKRLTPVVAPISRADANAYKAWFENEYAANLPEIKEAVKDMRAWNDGALQYARDAGVLSKEGVDAMRKLDPFYISFARAVGNEEGVARVGMYSPGQPVKAFKRGGSPDWELMDPYEAMVRHAEQLMLAADRNTIAKSIVGAYEGRGGMSRWLTPVNHEPGEVQRLVADFVAEANRRGVPLTGQGADDVKTLISQIPAMASKDNNLIVVYEGGRPRTYAISQELHTALKGMPTSQLRGVGLMIRGMSQNRWVRGGAALQRFGAVGLRPMFAVVNGMRDAAQVMVKEGVRGAEMLARGYAHVLAENTVPAVTTTVGAALGGVPGAYAGSAIGLAIQKSVPWLDEAPKRLFTKWGLYAEDLAKAYGASGVSGSAVQAYANPRRVRGLARSLVESSRLDPARNVIADWVDLFSATEAAPRVGAFAVELRKQGWRPGGAAPTADMMIRAARRASEITVDFSRSGWLGSDLNKILVFLNAQLQSLPNFGRWHKSFLSKSAWKNGENAAKMLRVSSLVTLPQLALYARNRDRTWYKEAHDYDRRNFSLIETDQGIVRIPVPFEFGPLYGSLPIALLDMATSGDPTWEWSEIAELGDDMVFGGVAEGRMIPSAIRPGLEWYMNRDFFRGGHIVSPYDQQRLPGHQQRRPWTPETFVDATKWAFDKSGGTIDVSPEQLFHFVDTTVGGWAHQFGEKNGRADITRRFWLHEGQGKSEKKLYDLRFELQKAKNGNLATAVDLAHLKEIDAYLSGEGEYQGKGLKDMRERIMDLRAAGEHDKARKLNEERQQATRDMWNKFKDR